MITIAIIAITCLVSILCFNGRMNGSRLLFNACQVWYRKEWYRMFTSGMIHSGWGHLFFNMLTLYFFGRVVEQYFMAVFGNVAASILFAPKMGIYIYLIPIPVPGYIFAPLYLLYCWYMAKRNMDNIGHTAHFWGAVYGLLFPVVCKPGIISFCLSQFGL